MLFLFYVNSIEATLMHLADTAALCRGASELLVYAPEGLAEYHALAAGYVKEVFGGKVKVEVSGEAQNSIGLLLGEGESIWNSPQNLKFSLLSSGS